MSPTLGTCRMWGQGPVSPLSPVFPVPVSDHSRLLGRTGCWVRPTSCLGTKCHPMGCEVFHGDVDERHCIFPSIGIKMEVVVKAEPEDDSYSDRCYQEEEDPPDSTAGEQGWVPMVPGAVLWGSCTCPQPCGHPGDGDAVLGVVALCPGPAPWG